MSFPPRMRGPRYGVTCSGCLLVTLPRAQLDTAWFVDLLTLGNLGVLLAPAVTGTSTAIAAVKCFTGQSGNGRTHRNTHTAFAVLIQPAGPDWPGEVTGRNIHGWISWTIFQAPLASFCTRNLLLSTVPSANLMRTSTTHP